MNKREPTYKKEEQVWITLDDWSITDWMMFDERIRSLFMTEQELPVIAY